MALSKIETGSLNFTPATKDGTKNLIINGAMQVAQRGTSFSSISSDQYTLDRFIAFHTSVTPTITQESLSVGQTDLPSSFRNYLRFAAGTGAAVLGFGTRIEDVSKYYGTYKLSFYAKGTNPAGGSFQQRMIQRFGTGGSSQVITDNGTFTVTSSWQRFEIDVTVPSVSGKTIGTGSYLQMQFNQPSTDSGTSAWTLDITGVQLEVGDTATPFEHRSFADELVRCQRYFMQWKSNNATREFVAMCTYFDDDDGHGIISTPVTMRTYPSILYNDLAVFKRGVTATNSVVVQSVVAPIGDANTIPFNMDNAGGLNAGEAFFVGFASTTTGYIKLDAEL